MATVSNPYQFKISNSTSFSTTLSPSLPTQETTLFTWEGDNFVDDSITLTIPAGVTVVKVLLHAEEATGDDNPASITLASVTTSVDWSYLSVSMGASESLIKYVGVTPSKTYKLYLITESPAASYFGCTIYYSTEINTHTPDVTDY